MSTLRAYWQYLVMIMLTIALASVAACQSLPEGLKIGAKSTLRAAIECIDGDSASAPRQVRIERCAGAILVEAGEALDEIESLPVGLPAPSSTHAPSAPPAPAAPAQPAESPPSSASAPEVAEQQFAKALRRYRPDRDGPPCKGWPYRYKRG